MTRVALVVPKNHVVTRKTVISQTAIPQMLGHCCRMGSPFLSGYPPARHQTSHEVCGDVIGVDNLKKDEAATWLQGSADVPDRCLEIRGGVEHASSNNKIVGSSLEALVFNRLI